MKKLVKILSAIILVSVVFAGCKGKDPQGSSRSRDTDDTEETVEVDEDVLANAKTVFDLSSYMTVSEDELLYSECKRDKELHFYFDVLSFDQYIKVNYKGKDYALLYFYYNNYGAVATDVKSVKKSYSGDALDLEVDVKTKEVSNDGCFSNTTRCRLIVKLDQDVSSISVMGKPFAEYEGGKVYVCEKYGIVDKDLNFLLPPVYDGIFELYTFTESSCPMYYRVFKDGYNGVLDGNFNRVLSNSYGNIYYINENKFIVGTNGSDPALDEILIVDGNENVIKKAKGFLCATDDSKFYCPDGYIKICDPSAGDMWGEGVIDQDLNIVIEPIYYSVYFLDGVYKAEDFDFNEIWIDIDGNVL